MSGRINKKKDGQRQQKSSRRVGIPVGEGAGTGRTLKGGRLKMIVHGNSFQQRNLKLQTGDLNFVHSIFSILRFVFSLLIILLANLMN